MYCNFCKRDLHHIEAKLKLIDSVKLLNNRSYDHYDDVS